MFLLNSRSMLVTAAHLREHPFSRSYGVNLPSSLTRVISNTLVSSTHLPVSVCGTTISLEGFLDDSHPYFAFPEGSTCPAPSFMFAHLTTNRPGAFTHTTNSCARDLSHVTPSLIILVTEYQPCVHRLRPSASA